MTSRQFFLPLTHDKKLCSDGGLPIGQQACCAIAMTEEKREQPLRFDSHVERRQGSLRVKSEGPFSGGPDSAGSQ